MSPQAHQTRVNFFSLILLYFINWILDTYFYIYYFCPSFDIPMHFLGGVLVAKFFYAIFVWWEKKYRVVIKPRWALIVCLVGLVGLTAYAWEVYEYLHDVIFGTYYQRGAVDLLQDMFFGTLGGFLFCLFFIPKPGVRRTSRKTKRS